MRLVVILFCTVWSTGYYSPIFSFVLFLLIFIKVYHESIARPREYWKSKKMNDWFLLPSFNRNWNERKKNRLNFRKKLKGEYFGFWNTDTKCEWEWKWVSEDEMRRMFDESRKNKLKGGNKRKRMNERYDRRKIKLLC